MKRHLKPLSVSAFLAAALALACPAGQLEGVNLLHLSHVHRGGGKLERPDNTLETFLWCWGNGSALECDCRRTKDGVGIMLHDLHSGEFFADLTADLAVEFGVDTAVVRIGVADVMEEMDLVGPVIHRRFNNHGGLEGHTGDYDAFLH